MFCPKCGNQVPDGSTFCANCGHRMDGAAAASGTGYRAAYSSGPSPLAKSLLTKLAGFFTTNRQEAVVTDAARDTTWSGAIVAGVGILIYTLTQMVNVIAAGRGYLTMLGVGFGDSFDATSRMEIGVPTILSLVFALVYAGALVGMVMAMARMCKIKLPFVNALNVAAYASLPVAVIGIPNMLFGLLWGAFPILFFLIAMIASFYLIHQALVKAWGLKNSFFPFLLLITAMVVIVVAGAYFTFSAAV